MGGHAQAGVLRVRENWAKKKKERERTHRQKQQCSDYEGDGYGREHRRDKW